MQPPPRIHFVSSGETVEDISPSKLQSSLADSPECVLVPGRCQTLFSRFEELGMFSCRGGGNGFDGENATFHDLICIKDVTVCGSLLVRMGRGCSFKFDAAVSQQDMEAVVSAAAAAAGSNQGLLLPA